MTHCYVCFETLKHATLTWAVAARLQAEATTHTHIEDAYIQGARNAAGQHVHPLTPAPNHTQITFLPRYNIPGLQSVQSVQYRSPST